MPQGSKVATMKEKSMSKEMVKKVVDTAIEQNPIVFKRLAEI